MHDDTSDYDGTSEINFTIISWGDEFKGPSFADDDEICARIYLNIFNALICQMDDYFRSRLIKLLAFTFTSALIHRIIFSD